MMNCLVEIVECVPNYSLSGDEKIIQEVITPFLRYSDITLLGVESDVFYNRTVVSLLGNPQSIIKALIDSYLVVDIYVDLRSHQGEHPYIGAIDVIPFIPILNSSVSKCTEYSRKLASQLWDKLQVPSYMYNLSATQENRRLLPNIRKGGFRKLSEKIKQAEWQLDFGDGVNERLGVSVIGCRKLLVAYNIDINTMNKKITDDIARSIRESSGGFRAVQAQSARLDNHYQVTINITDYQITSLFTVYQCVEKLAKRNNCEIISSEIIGLVLKEVFDDVVFNATGINDEKLINILENKIKLRDFTNKKFLDNYLLFDKI